MRRIVTAALLLLLAACAGTTTQYTRADAKTVAAEAARQEALVKSGQIAVNYTPLQLTDDTYMPEDRMVMIAGRILAAGAPYCGTKVTRSFLLGVRSYGNQPVVVTSPVAVKAPGEKNDIRRNDQIQAINGVAIGNGTPGLNKLVGILKTAAEQNRPLIFQLQRELVPDLIKVKLVPVPRCDYGVRVDVGTDEVNAYADGRNLHFTLPLMKMLSDDELAFVAGHEMAHNILTHVSKTQNNMAVGGLGGMLVDVIASTQGVNTDGRFGNMGAQMGQMRYSQDFERESDYMGMYITELAGFAPEAAVSVVEKFSRQNPDSIRYASTHPANAERAANARLTLAEIRQKQATRQPLYPNMKPVQ